jgi:hypothetical protein
MEEMGLGDEYGGRTTSSKKGEMTRKRLQGGETQHTTRKRGGWACASSSVLRSCDYVESSVIIKPDPKYPSSTVDEVSKTFLQLDVLRTVRAVRRGRKTF